MRRFLIHFLAHFRAHFRKRKPTGYELPEIDSPFAEPERLFVATHRMSGARVDYTEQSIAYLDQVAHKLLQWHPSQTEGDEDAVLTTDEWEGQVDRFITMGGSYLGSVIILKLGGRWIGSPDNRDQMSVDLVGGTEVAVRPFQMVSDRMHGHHASIWRAYRSLKREVERKKG